MIQKKQKGCILLVNKWDLSQEAGVTQRKYGEALREALPFLNYAPVVFTSAKSGYNVRKSIEIIDYVGAQLQARLSTGVLNRVLHDAFNKVSPPAVKGKRLKFFYATQTGTRPVRVRLFVNQPRRITSSYRQYLIRKLREAFGLEGVQVVLQFHSRSQKSQGAGGRRRVSGF